MTEQEQRENDKVLLEVSTELAAAGMSTQVQNVKDMDDDTLHTNAYRYADYCTEVAAVLLSHVEVITTTHLNMVQHDLDKAAQRQGKH